MTGWAGMHLQQYLVKRIVSTPFTAGSYSIHLCGPWGSGKSTVLKFIKHELNEINKKKDKAKHKKNDKRNDETEYWMTVDFNAWQHQDISPPWWSLYSLIYKAIKRRLCFVQRIRELLWRLFSGQALSIIVLVLVIWGLVFFFPIMSKMKTGDSRVENTTTLPADITNDSVQSVTA